MDAQHDIGSVAFGQQMNTYPAQPSLGTKTQHFSPHCGDLDPDQLYHPERVGDTVVVGKLAMVFLGTESRWFSSPTIWIYRI